MEVALYVRVSTSRQQQAQTIEQQLERLRAHVADQQEWHLGDEHIYRHDGYSGARLNRPGLDRLRDQVALGSIELVLVTAPDRLARKYVHQVLLVEELRGRGCQIEFLDRPMSDDPHDQLLLQIRGAVAEYERSLIAERMRRGRQAKMRSGLLLPWTKAPYGYILDSERPRDASRVHVDLIKAEVVKQIFAWYTDPATPATLYWVAKTLSDRQLPTPTGGVRWNVASVRGILRSPAYAGTAYSGRTRQTPSRRRKSALQPVGLGHSQQATPEEEWIAIPVPSFVSQETFDMAQQRLDQNKQMARRNNHAHDYLLRNLVSCGQCRLACTGRQISVGYSYYICHGRTDALGTAKAERCTARYVPAAALDLLVWQDLCRILTNPALVTHELARAQAGEWLPQALQDRQRTLRASVAQLERQQTRLLEVYLAEVIGRDEFERKQHELVQTQNGLTQQLRQLEVQAQKQLDVTKLATHINDFCQRLAPTLEQLSFAQRRQLVELLIDCVIVDNDKVEIRYVIPTGPHGEQTPFSHLRKDHFNDVTRTDGPPVHPGEGVEGQTGVEIALETINGGGIRLLELGAESGRHLLGLEPIILVENGLQFRFDGLLMLFWDVTQYVLDLVHDAALTLGFLELGVNGADHRLVSIGDPEINLRHTSSLDILHEIVPCGLVLAIAGREGQHLACAIVTDTDNGQNGHFAAFILVFDREIGAIGKSIAVVSRQRPLFPGIILAFQRMEDTRNG
jgi:site-specific DNA recombinase